MISKDCKRLSEVAEVSKPCGAGEIERWPLASSRAVSKALLLTDPCDVHCPEAFKKKAPQIFLGMNGRRARQAGA